MQGEVVLCTEPPSADDGEWLCVLQDGLTLGGKPVYACTAVKEVESEDEDEPHDDQT